MTFYRAYAYLAAPFLILAMSLSLAFDFGFGLLASTIAAMILAAIAAGLVSWFSHKVGTFAAMVYTGSGGVSAREQHASNVIRARYLKTQGRFNEAMTVIDEYLVLVPGEPEGLFLKAQILVAAKGDLALAKRCLDLAIENAPADDIYHRWAKNLLNSLRTSYTH